MSSISALIIGASMALVACGSDDGGTAEPGGAGGTSGGGKGGTAGTAGKGGTNQGGTAGTGAGTAGAAGTINPAAGPGGSAGAAGNAGGAAGNAGGAAGSTSGSGGQAGEACQGEPGKNLKVCRPATDNECDGKAPSNFKPEGTTGNGFDDDCDGLVDEGCACDNVGATKDCYALPSTQTDGAPNWKPVGACADPNNGQLGKATCKLVGDGEFAQKLYTGECVGAQPPPVDDTCDTTKDVNCDGVPGNAPNKCACSSILCPGVLYTTPFPDPKNIGQFSKNQVGPTDPKEVDGIDGMTWLGGNQAIIDSVKNWRWSVTGGPCDDTLPNPTFALFPTKEGSPIVPWETHLGVKSTGLPNFPDISGDPAIHKGWVVAENGPSKIYPAFSLSGDYYITGKFTFNNPLKGGMEDEGICTQIVKVRAPGLRVELCWPEVGQVDADKGNDVDLHVARLQGNPKGDGKHGWFTTAGSAPYADDCYYSPQAMCGNRTKTSGPLGEPGQLTPGWYDAISEISDEPGGVGVCHGWGSRRFATRACTNPRLDRDNINCNPVREDPNYPEQDPDQTGKNPDNFCGPENINLDNPNPGERFAIGVQCYNCIPTTNNTTPQPAHPRINVYCDGNLEFNFGYDPSKPLDASNPQYPQLLTEGQSTNGAFWNAAVVTWTGNNGMGKSCAAQGIQAGVEWNADPWRTQSNGSESNCVMNAGLNKDGANFTPATGPQADWKFTPDGSYPDPANPDALCPY